MREAGLGIDIGNGSISIVVVEGENIIYKDYRLHRGELYQNLVDMLGQVETSCGDRILYAAVNPGAVCLYPGIQKRKCRSTASAAFWKDRECSIRTREAS